mmetsp:Transcript_17553/g.68086  ORF Transcript_17553/g.68086 Transcript_17553/m.68086 type:complete len:772 (-) Transcript_17553:57-2372(-)
MGDSDKYVWRLHVEFGKDLVECDLLGGSDPFVSVCLLENKKKESKVQKVKTPMIKGDVNPIWNFQAYQLPTEKLQKKYKTIRFEVWNHNLIGSHDFMGIAEVPMTECGEPPERKSFDLKLQPRTGSAAKKDKPVTGMLNVKSEFVKVKGSRVASMTMTKKERKNSASLIKAATTPTTDRRQSSVTNAQVLGNTESKVTVGASGKRELKIPTSLSVKFISFPELPPFEIIADKPDKKKSREERKYGFSTNNALWLITLMQLAYKKKEIVEDVCNNVYDMEYVRVIDHDESDTHCFITYNSRIITITFRGTDSLKNWLTNLDFIPTDEAFPARYGKMGVTVHGGFNSALMCVWEEIQSVVNEAFERHPDLRLFISGHSLGGALANLCYAHFTFGNEPRHVGAVYTIGQPCAGNAKFVKILAEESPQTIYIRVTNNQDVVPSVAPGEHCGVNIHFNSSGELHFDPGMFRAAINQIGSIHGSMTNLSHGAVADHAVPEYRKLMEQYWAKYEPANYNGPDRVLKLTHHLVHVIDMIVEDIRGVQRYHGQFRFLASHVLGIRPLFNCVLDHMEKFSKSQLTSLDKIETSLVKYLANFRREVIMRHKDQATISLTSVEGAEKAFNTSIMVLATKIQTQVDALHKFLTKHACKDIDAHRKKYNGETYAVALTAGNMDLYLPPVKESYKDKTAEEKAALKAAAKELAEKRAKASVLIDEIEMMLEEDKSAEAEEVLKVVETMPDLDEGQKAFILFLKAKAQLININKQSALKSLEAAADV